MIGRCVVLPSMEKTGRVHAPIERQSAKISLLLEISSWVVLETSSSKQYHTSKRGVGIKTDVSYIIRWWFQISYISPLKYLGKMNPQFWIIDLGWLEQKSTYRNLVCWFFPFQGGDFSLPNMSWPGPGNLWPHCPGNQNRHSDILSRVGGQLSGGMSF